MAERTHQSLRPRKKTVLVFGTFDRLHLGHENFFEQARILGSRLVAVVARDSTVKRVKGKSPEKNERDRVLEVRDNPNVDEALLGGLDDKYKIIGKVKPDVIALGYDQFVFTHRLPKVLIDLRLNTEIVRLKPYKPELYKSSLLEKKALPA